MLRLQTYIIVFILVAHSNVAIFATKTVKQLQLEMLKEIRNVYVKINQSNETIEKRIIEQDRYIIQLHEELKNETAMRK